jgi:hypothetical protein
MRDESVKYPCPEPGGEPVDWTTFVPGLIHPTKVLVIEATLWIGRPLSASELEKVFDNTLGVSTISYHLRSLAPPDARGTSAGRRRESATRAAQTR